MYICDICEIYFVCLDGIGKTNKKVCTGHFAECDTRQRGTLPSVRTIALDKEPRPEHRYRFFVECSGSGTRQRSTLCRVSYKALGKELDMGTPLTYFLPSAGRQTLGKGNSFAECHLGHSAKTPSPSPGVVTAAFLYRVHPGTRQSLCRVPEKKYSAKKALSMHCVPSSLCRVRHSKKPLPSVFKALPSASVDSDSETLIVG
jgi:hypothetical protein